MKPAKQEDLSRMKTTGMPRSLLLAEPLSAVIALAALALLPDAAPSRQERQPSRRAENAMADASLPNGASSINETYGDWTVLCGIIEDDKVCTFSQTHTSNQTRQRVFGIELQPPADGRTNSVILLPFGLRLDDGVTLKIDEETLEPGARFSTCVPAGCLVPVAFPTAATEAMKRGEKLVVTANSAGGGEPRTFTISLNGFTIAFNRTVELAK